MSQEVLEIREESVSYFFLVVLEEIGFGQCPLTLDLCCGLAAWLLLPLPAGRAGWFSTQELSANKRKYS